MKFKSWPLWVMGVLFFCISARAEPPFLRIVQPYENQNIPAVESSFVFGSVLPATCTLIINGVLVKPHTNGGFITMIPFHAGAFKIEAIASDGVAVTTVTRAVNVAENPSTLPADFLFIDPLFPLSKTVLQAGDIADFSFRGTSGGTATVKIGGRPEPLRLVEQGNGSKGIYKAAYRIQPSDRFEEAEVTYHLKWANGKKIAKKADGVLVVKKRESPRYIELNEDAVVLTGPQSEFGYELFLLKGVTLEVTGEVGEFYRVALGTINQGWVKKIAATELPAGTVISRTIAHNLRVSTIDSSTIIEIPLGRRHAHRVDQYTDPHRLVLSLYGVVADSDRMRYKNKNSVVKEITWRQRDTETCEFEIQTRQKYPWGYDVRYEGNTLVLEIRHRPLIGVGFGGPLKGLKIAVDAGHSKQSYGTIGPWGNPESSVTLAVALVVKQEFEKRGAQIVMIQDGSRNPSLRERSEMAWKEKADIFLSIHCDASPEGQDPRTVEGYSIHYYTPQSRLLGEEMYAVYGEKTKVKEQGLWRSNLSVCRAPQMPSLLIELGFLVLPEMEEQLLKPKFQQQIADAFVVAVTNFMSKSQQSKSE